MSTAESIQAVLRSPPNCALVIEVGALSRGRRQLFEDVTGILLGLADGSRFGNFKGSFNATLNSPGVLRFSWRLGLERRLLLVDEKQRSPVGQLPKPLYTEAVNWSEVLKVPDGQPAGYVEENVPFYITPYNPWTSLFIPEVIRLNDAPASGNEFEKMAWLLEHSRQGHSQAARLLSERITSDYTTQIFLPGLLDHCFRLGREMVGDALLEEWWRRWNVDYDSFRSLEKSDWWKDAKALSLPCTLTLGWAGYCWWEVDADLQRGRAAQWCKHCKRPFFPHNAMQQYCGSLECNTGRAAARQRNRRDRNGR